MSYILVALLHTTELVSAAYTWWSVAPLRVTLNIQVTGWEYGLVVLWWWASNDGSDRALLSTAVSSSPRSAAQRNATQRMAHAAQGTQRRALKQDTTHHNSSQPTQSITLLQFHYWLAGMMHLPITRSTTSLFYSSILTNNTATLPCSRLLFAHHFLTWPPWQEDFQAPICMWACPEALSGRTNAQPLTPLTADTTPCMFPLLYFSFFPSFIHSFIHSYISWSSFGLLFLQWDYRVVLHLLLYSKDELDCGLWLSWDILSSLTMDSIGVTPKYHYWRRVKQREQGEYKERGEVRWDEMRWDEMRWDEMRWDEMRWDEMRWDERGGMNVSGLHLWGKISSLIIPFSYLFMEWDMVST